MCYVASSLLLGGLGFAAANGAACWKRPAPGDTLMQSNDIGLPIASKASVAKKKNARNQGTDVGIRRGRGGDEHGGVLQPPARTATGRSDGG